MVRLALVILFCGTACCGCAVHELHKDQDLIRCTLLDLYENQIMDNLIRASNGLPIIQLDYSQAQAQVSIKKSVGGSDNQATTVGNVFALPAASLMATRNIVTTLMGNLSADNTNQVTLYANPLTTSNEVYDAYLEFLDHDRNPGSLMVQCDQPKPGTVHLWRKYDGKYYYVPLEYRQLFFRLALLTTAQRGKSLMAPDEFYTVKVLAVVGKPEPGIVLGTTLLKIEVDDKKLPTDDRGDLVLDNDNEHTHFRLEPDPNLQGVFQISVPDGSKPDLKSKLSLFNNLAAAPQPGKIFFLHRRPRPQTTDDMLNRVNFQLQNIQFNQQRLGSP